MVEFIWEVAYRRDRNIREAYDEHFQTEREMPYPRAVNMGERRGEFSRPEEYPRGFDYDHQRHYPNGVPRTYHGDEHKGYHADNAQFGNMRRNGPPSRREEGYQHYRGSRDESHPGGRQVEFREDRDHFRRKGSFPSQRDRSPNSRSGSSHSSRSYSPDKTKSYTYQNQQKKSVDISGQDPSRGACPPWGGDLQQNSGNVVQDKDRLPGHPLSGSRDVSPQSSASISKEEPRGLGAEYEEAPLPIREIPVLPKDEVKERRSQAIAAKAREIEQVFRQDCETFGMVVKMLVAKDPSLESQLQKPLRENLGEIQQRCLEDLRHFIFELDEILQPDTSS
ncbi:hypothetical protein AAFF_G00356360 [Aldrovandia affinis]|uniref:Periphilin-1 C-terminal domain-containing protein n=1 Tax=Aldrovandia affinis TaxID=143900 RepID=A0AAD7T8X8_9TELE|nr:hypothetical protein AAFF_G00356360 [Aldrovandia affinis]